MASPVGMLARPQVMGCTTSGGAMDEEVGASLIQMLAPRQEMQVGVGMVLIAKLEGCHAVMSLLHSRCPAPSLPARVHVALPHYMHLQICGEAFELPGQGRESPSLPSPDLVSIGTLDDSLSIGPSSGARVSSSGMGGSEPTMGWGGGGAGTAASTGGLVHGGGGSQNFAPWAAGSLSHAAGGSGTWVAEDRMSPVRTSATSVRTALALATASAAAAAGAGVGVVGGPAAQGAGAGRAVDRAQVVRLMEVARMPSDAVGENAA